MPPRSSLSARERDARSRLHSLLERADDFLHGSPIDMARRCGNPKCKCATSDKHKHRCFCLGRTRKGKSSTLYIPRHLEARVREGIDSYRLAADLLAVLDEEARARLAKLKTDAKAARTAKTAKTKAKRASKAKPKTKTAKATAKKRTGGGATKRKPS
jgi:hypothetical protein